MISVIYSVIQDMTLNLFEGMDDITMEELHQTSASSVKPPTSTIVISPH